VDEKKSQASALQIPENVIFLILKLYGNPLNMGPQAGSVVI